MLGFFLLAAARRIRARARFRAEFIKDGRALLLLAMIGYGNGLPHAATPLPQQKLAENSASMPLD